MIKKSFTIKMLIVALTLAGVLTSCSSSPEQSADGTWSRPSAWDTVPQNLLDAVYDKDPKAAWWGRITGIERMLGSDDNFVSMRVTTNYRLDNPADVIEATNMCNAMVTSISQEGWLVDVTGIINEGITNADGSIETAEYDRERITTGQSWDADYSSDYCQARALFTDVVEGLKANGWTEQYLEDSRDPSKVYESIGAQDGDIWFVDTGY